MSIDYIRLSMTQVYSKRGDFVRATVHFGPGQEESGRVVSESMTDGVRYLGVKFGAKDRRVYQVVEEFSNELYNVRQIARLAL